MNASTTPTTNASAGEASGVDDGPSPSTSSSPSSGSSASAGDADSPPEPEDARDGPVIDVTIDRAAAQRIDERRLSQHVERVVVCLRKYAPAASFAQVAVTVVDDRRMSALHKEHCGVDAPTDVLTFVVSDPGEPIDAQIAVCADEASRRAAEFSHTVERELLLYIVHGLLHCCGYDDHDDADFVRMHETEDAILEAIGIGRTFSVKNSRRGAENAGEGKENG